VAGFTTLCPDHHHEPAIEMTRGDETSLSIVSPGIDDRGREAGEHLVGPREI